MARKGGNPGTYFRAESCPEKVAKQAIAVKLPLDLDEYVRSLPNRAEWLREAIALHMERERLVAANTEEGDNKALGIRQ